MAWRIEFESRALKELESLDPPARRRIIDFLRQRVAPLADPRAIGEALHGPVLGRFWKYRVGDYWIVCRIEDQSIMVLVLRVGHRREIYR